MLPRERDHLIISQVCFLAQKRLARGVLLNHSEAAGLIAGVVAELIRDGKHSLAELMDLGRRILSPCHVLPQVLHTLKSIQIEGSFIDGTKLVTLHEPLAGNGDCTWALYGSFLPVPDPTLFKQPAEYAIPGETFILPGSITLCSTRSRISIRVVNQGDRPVQVRQSIRFNSSQRSGRITILLKQTRNSFLIARFLMERNWIFRLGQPFDLNPEKQKQSRSWTLVETRSSREEIGLLQVQSILRDYQKF